MARPWMEGTVMNLPAGTNQLSANLQVDLTFGCLNRAGRSVPAFEEHHPVSSTWSTYRYDTPAGMNWERLGVGDDFYLEPHPWTIAPPSCPRGLTPAYVGSEVTSATVQYNHNGAYGPVIEVDGVFNYEPLPPA